MGVVWISATLLRWKNRGKSSNMPTPKLTTEIVNAAILGMEAQKQKLDAKIAELRALLTGGPAETPATPEPSTRKRKKFSAAARRKMALAQKARWAKIKGEPEPPSKAKPAAAPKPKRKLSAGGRKAIIAATKKYWALKRAEAAKVTKTAARKPAKKTIKAPKEAASKTTDQ
jgi:hypothetical protein